MTDTAVKDAPEQQAGTVQVGNDPSQIYVAGTGNIYTAPKDTVMPTVPLTLPLLTPWVDHGFASEDGVEFTFGRTVTDLKAWQSFDTVRLMTTDAPKSVKFTLMQSTASNIILALGGGVVTASGVFTPPDPTILNMTALFLVANDGGSIWGFYCPRALVQDNVVIPWKKSGEAQLPLVFSIQATAAGTPNYQFVFPTSFGQTMAQELDDKLTKSKAA
jgi:hypothetical protein